MIDITATKLQNCVYASTTAVSTQSTSLDFTTQPRRRHSNLTDTIDPAEAAAELLHVLGSRIRRLDRVRALHYRLQAGGADIELAKVIVGDLHGVSWVAIAGGDDGSSL